MLKIVTRFVFFALMLGVFSNSNPAFANENKAVICGWQMTDSKTGIKYAYFYKNDLTVKSQIFGYSDEEYHRHVCDEPVYGATDETYRMAAANPWLQGKGVWKKQRFETTWADRCNDSDPVAMYFGTKRESCVDYEKGKDNWAKPNQSTPHDLLSCMRNGHTYYIEYDGKQLYISEVNGRSFYLKDAQLNCKDTPRQLFGN